VSEVTAPASRRAPLPEGTLPVGAALLIAGVATFAFFKIGQEALGGPVQFQPMTALWFATFALAPGFFLPLEQELGRAVSHRRARSEGGAPVMRRVVRLGVAITVLVVVTILALSPLITSNYFDGNWWMLVALTLAFASYAPAHLARGICSGSGRFRYYALIIGSDGVIRIVACVAFWLAGIHNPAPYALAVALSPLVAVIAIGARGGLRLEEGPPAAWNEVTQNLGWLLVGSVLAGSLLNAGPIAAKLLGDEAQHARITEFGNGVLLARIPLFLFQAVQAALLPRLARLAAQGEYDEFRAGYARLMRLVVMVGVAGTVGAFLLGPFMVDTMFGADLTGRTMATLALSSALYMAAIATAQAVVALHGHGWVALGWAVAVVSFVIAVWLSSPELFRRIEIALAVSSLAALIVFAIALRRRLAAPITEPRTAELIPELPLDG
jgi:O-antigen/teichoic acid export membrane protein